MIIVIRHGERADMSQNEIEINKIETYFDPHLTEVGVQQAKESGQYIYKLLQEHAKRFQLQIDEIEPVILCSPFLRCLMTAKNVCSQLPKFHKQTIYIQEELTELMYSCDFDHNVLPELKIRTENLQELSKKYLNLGDITISKQYFEDPRFIKPKCPESHQFMQQRFAAFTEVLLEQVVKREDFRKKVFICVTHQGVLEVKNSLKTIIQKEIMFALDVQADKHCDFCALIQIMLPNCEQGDQTYEVPIRGLSFCRSSNQIRQQK